MLYITSPELICLITVSFNLLTTFTHFFQVLMSVQIFLEPLPWNCPLQEYEVWGAGSGSRRSQEDGSGSRYDVWVWIPI